MKFYLLIFTTALFLSPAINNSASAESQVKQGDIVFAEWVVNGWYHGRVGHECGDGNFMIFFDDGDTKCCSTGVIVRDVVPGKTGVLPGIAVLARWIDGRYYPGTVSVINGDIYNINFNDGDKVKVTLDQIRLRD